MNSTEMLYWFLNTAKNSIVAKEEQIVFRDCAAVFKAGHTTSGVYTLTFPNSTEEIKVSARLPPWHPGSKQVALGLGAARRSPQGPEY